MGFLNSLATSWEEFALDGAVLQRKVVSTLGYDCRAGCSASCPHSDKTRDYGCHGDQHALALRSEIGAASLILFSSYLRGEMLLPVHHDGPMWGAALARCWTFPTDAGQVRRGSAITCPWQRAGLCYPEYYSALRAREMVRAASRSQFPTKDVDVEAVQRVLLEQRPLWNDLGRFLLSAEHEMVKRNDALPKRCPTCDGEGVVPQKESS